MVTMIKLLAQPHTSKSAAVIEIWETGPVDHPMAERLLGVIYPTSRGVKIISKYIEARDDLLQVEALEPAAVLVNLLRERVVDVNVADVKSESK